RDAIGVVAQQEVDRREEVRVVILVLDLRVGRVELVGGCGEEQRAHGLAFGRLRMEERLRELGRGIALALAMLEQRLEALELVEDHKIGLKRLDADRREQLAQLAEDAVAQAPGLQRIALAVPAEPGVDRVVYVSPQPPICTERLAERLCDTGLERQRLVVQ